SRLERPKPCLAVTTPTNARPSTWEGSLVEPADDRKTPADAVKGLNLWYGSFQALHDVNLVVPQGKITSLIGPSGCGKSTLLRACNRIIQRLEYVRIQGSIEILGTDVFAPEHEVVQVRKQVGMVFQRPNPLPLSIRDNVLFGLRLHDAGARKASRDELDHVVQSSLEQVLLWDEVKDRLDAPARVLSLEAQQKLCIARLLPVKPRLLLMDEPCSALDPKATAAVEELIWELRGEYTILIVTHNMAQARRASEECVFMLLGKVIEHSATDEMFVTPKNQKTADYIEGRYG
ncbi:MAG TPA: phosphate ABC transporter ATP-binding protein, partial [Polyangiaceae bacterium]|nr:phosphate ABC transporter ATP-binding protein [Polyangiaceae bacterium]